MGRPHARSFRLALVVGLVTALGAVAASAAYALAFDDGAPCPANSAGVYVCPGGTVGSSYSLQIVARGGCEPEFSFSIINGALPAGLSMSSNGRISGTPSQAGNSRFWIRVHDIPPSDGGAVWCTNPKNAEREFAINIDSRVIVTTESVGPGTIGAPYNTALVAQMMSGPNQLSQPSSPLGWSLVGGALPPGIALDSATGVLSGTPTTEGSFGFVVKAALTDGRSDTKALTIVVRQPLSLKTAPPFPLDSVSLLWEVGVPFASKLVPGGGSGTYTFTIVEGSLPTGMALGADGTIAGKPKEAGPSTSKIRLADSEGRVLDVPAAFVVAKRLAVSTVALKRGKVGRKYRSKLATAGGIPPKIWRVAKGPLPRGIHFNRKAGLLVGVPKKPGSYRVRFEVRDGLKVIARKTLRIVVAP